MCAMVAQDSAGPVANLELLRVERDRRIALEYLRGSGERGVVQALMRKFGVSRRTVYRCVDREGDWAADVIKKESGA